jgi:hypothetical protein
MQIEVHQNHPHVDIGEALRVPADTDSIWVVHDHAKASTRYTHAQEWTPSATLHGDAPLFEISGNVLRIHPKAHDSDFV